eukprot:2458566-Pyramimonas_sp.AAC.1
MQKCNIPDALKPLTNLALEAPVLMQHLEDRPHLAQQLVETHRLTHFGMADTEEVALSRRSTRPGNSLADYLFNVIFTKPLDYASEALKDQGLYYEVPERDSRHPSLSKHRTAQRILTDVSFVDDALFVVQAPNDTMLTAMRKTADT